MREIVFDTETTGLDPYQDRIIELGGVELDNRFLTGRTFHYYINPQGRQINAEAQAVHGIGAADLVDKPPFDQIADEFLAFIDGAKLIAHNASFDISFINAEFERLGHLPVVPDRVVDTLAIARRKHPMGPNSLDALCRRYGIDNSRRTKHGALLDSELLAEVYIELVGGKQASLVLETAMEVQQGIEIDIAAVTIGARPRPLTPRLSEAELAAHAAMVAGLGDAAIWKRLNATHD
ncbi:DNA polymerase III subunit epsilon [Mesorhizobium sp. BAC0120]|uniref:DNA polymerase III subunit epsilon n=1 Tax=Mesorhizobium sp. BAC0120 TaxID=3090670 RepID=UPI00298C8D76|nr:DNA polymerase III subunit epsilon [Mesorhizobium sp. BAC0120]MDW6024492.1 DNA polymerase III subunit epsilon [Mesorhizobium sp. BAC0120]